MPFAVPGAGKVLGCQAERSHLNVPWAQREVSARVTLHPLKELLEGALEEERNFPNTLTTKQVNDQTWLGTKESVVIPSEAPGDA